MKTTMRRALAALSVGAVALTGTVVLTSTTAQADTTVTDYGLQGGAWGTFATAKQAGLESGRTGHAFVGCTRLTGIQSVRSIAASEAPAGNPALKIGAVDSIVRTYKQDATGQVGSLSTNKVASVRLGPAEGPFLQIRGLTTQTEAFAKKDGTIGARRMFSSGDIELVGSEAFPIPPELEELFGTLNDTIAELFGAIQDSAGTLTIPGLGSIKMGGTRKWVKDTYAEARATALRVRLFGADMESDVISGGNDDTMVVIGHSRSRINRGLPVGVFRGEGFGLRAQLLDGLMRVGPIANQLLPCQGTGGEVYSNHVAALDLGNQGVINVEGLGGDSWGVQNENGYAKGWTRGEVAEIALGNADSSLVIRGIIGKATITRTKAGDLIKSIAGSQIGELIVNGEAQAFPDPGEALEIPGLATVRFLVKSSTTKADLKLVAVKIDLLDESLGVPSIELGVARTALRSR